MEALLLCSRGPHGHSDLAASPWGPGPQGWRFCLGGYPIVILLPSTGERDVPGARAPVSVRRSADREGRLHRLSTDFLNICVQWVGAPKRAGAP